MGTKIKAAEFLGDSRARLCAFPEKAQAALGYSLHLIQIGEEPSNWKPMTDIGDAVYELREQADKRAFRLAYIARFEEAIYVLHVFEKKTAKTAPKDKAVIEQRFKALVEARKAKVVQVRKENGKP